MFIQKSLTTLASLYNAFTQGKMAKAQDPKVGVFDDSQSKCIQEKKGWSQRSFKKLDSQEHAEGIIPEKGKSFSDRFCG